MPCAAFLPPTQLNLWPYPHINHQPRPLTAVILALEAGKDEAAIKYYGYPDVESKPLSDLSLLRPTPGGELGPGEATVGFECEVRTWVCVRANWGDACPCLRVCR